MRTKYTLFNFHTNTHRRGRAHSHTRTRARTHSHTLSLWKQLHKHKYRPTKTRSQTTGRHQGVHLWAKNTVYIYSELYIGSRKRHHLYTMANWEQATFKSSWATSVHSKIRQSIELTHTHTHSTLDKTGSMHTTVKEEASKHRDTPHWKLHLKT